MISLTYKENEQTSVNIFKHIITDTQCVVVNNSTMDGREATVRVDDFLLPIDFVHQ